MKQRQHNDYDDDDDEENKTPMKVFFIPFFPKNIINSGRCAWVMCTHRYRFPRGHFVGIYVDFFIVGKGFGWEVGSYRYNHSNYYIFNNLGTLGHINMEAIISGFTLELFEGKSYQTTKDRGRNKDSPMSIFCKE